MAKRIDLIASGSGTLAQAVIDAIKSGLLELDIVRVISDRPAEVLARAEINGIESTLIDYSKFSSREEWASELEKVIDADCVDLVVSVGFMRILPKNIVEKFPIINTHPALLPSFPGAHAVRDALAAGVQETGTSIHWVDAGVDTGKVISQVRIAVEPGDTQDSLHERIKIQERSLIVETLKEFVAAGLEK